MLDDTSLIDVSIRYIGTTKEKTGGTPAEELVFDGTVTKFIPATNAEKNEATIEYRPNFLKDGLYELAVNGTDKAGNKSGNTDYRISFEVINKSTITNVLNYPNPFSTSTAFVFTLTGSQVPSQFKIQVLSVTGKVVREITKAELGPLHVGRNLTEYKWDGKDQYGQMLGNGVYLYRVVTAINGEDIERRENDGVDKYIQKGYGKMYIMR
jgi:flagellar hook assembly protein FlgD